jgi:hypothetical protein
MDKDDFQKKIRSILLRGLGGANIVMGLLGAKQSVRVAFWYMRITAEPNVSVLFYLIILVNLCFAGVLVWAGAYLIRNQARGISISAVLFLAELTYFVALVLFTRHFPEQISNGQPALIDVANAGLAIQLSTRYPFIALLLLGITYWHVRRETPG